MHVEITRRLGAAVLCTGLTLGLNGCFMHKKQPVVATLPPILEPVPLIDVPRAAKEPVIERPVVHMPPMPVAAAAARPRPNRKRPVVAKAEPEVVPPPAPAPVAPPAPTAQEAAIGSLTAGGEVNAQTKQEVTDLIASIEKRLNALPAQKVEEQKSQVSQVKNFQRQAQEALNSGDAEGARTLATKAKLLLDDLEK